MKKQIVLKNVSVKHNKILALDNFSMKFSEYELWAIYGPNGAGKSTLLKAIVGLNSLISGKIIFKNLTRRDICYMSQIANIDQSVPISVFEMVACGLWYEISFYKSLSHEQKDRINTILEKLSIDHLSDRLISELSRGQLQRVLFARMLIQNAKVMLLDEPFNAIDGKTIEILLNIINECNGQGKTIITVTHDINQIKKYFPNLVLLSTKLIDYGKTSEVLSRVNFKEYFDRLS